MITLSASALKWILHNARPRWAWICVLLLLILFSIWMAIPDKYRALLIDYAVERASPGPKIDVEIADFKIPVNAGPDVVWLKGKVERNLVELFVTNGHRAANQLTILAPAARAHPALSGTIDEAGGGNLEISCRFTDASGAVVASTSLAASQSFLREHYKAIPEALVYGLDIGMKSLAPLATKSKLTTSLPAYMLYLEAQRAAEQEKLQAALQQLDAALQLDPRFAAAHAAAAEVLRALGQPEQAARRQAAADAINLDRPNVPFLSGIAKPLPAVLEAIRARDWVPIASGLKQKRARADAYGIAVAAWLVDPMRFSMRVAVQESPQGTAVRDLRKHEGAVLAVNGGFFDIDREERLTPAGYLVAQGREVSAAREGAGSAVLYRQDNVVGIGWSKDIAALKGVSEAVQAGPMLVEPGGKNGIRANDFNRHDRTAICLAPGGILVLVEKGGLSLYEIAAILSTPEKDGGFGCERAINLDGGPSTQASVAAEKDAIEIDAIWKVQNAVLFEPK